MTDANSRRQRSRIQEEDNTGIVIAIITEVSKTQLKVLVDHNNKAKLANLLRYNRNFRMDQFVKDGTVQVQLQTLQRLLLQVQENNPDERNIREIILGNPELLAYVKQSPSWAQEQRWQLAVEEVLSSRTPYLNHSQKRALQQALMGTFTLWQVYSLNNTKIRLNLMVNTGCNKR